MSNNEKLTTVFPYYKLKRGKRGWGEKREAEKEGGGEGGRAVRFEIISLYQSFDFVVKKILLFPNLLKAQSS